MPHKRQYTTSDLSQHDIAVSAGGHYEIEDRPQSNFMRHLNESKGE